MEQHPLRIAFVAERTPFTRSEQRMRALDDLGAEVLPIALAPPSKGPADQPERRLLDRVAHRLGRPLDRAGVNRALLELVAQTTPDVIWIEGGRTVRPKTLRELRRLAPAAVLVLFTEDDLALAHNRNVHLSTGIGLVDLLVTTKRSNVEHDELAKLGARRVHYEAKTFDPWFHRPLRLRPGDRERLGGPIGFLGRFEERRASSCLALAEAGFPVRVFGNGWSGLRGLHPHLIIEDRPLGGEDYVRSICATDLNLSFLRQANAGRHTERSIEVPACGGFLLAERSEEHRELFVEGAEADYFEGDAELIERCRQLLDQPDRRRAIAAAGRLRCVESGYDHASSVLRVLDKALAIEQRSLREFGSKSSLLSAPHATPQLEPLT